MILLSIDLALDAKPKTISFYGGVLHGMVAQSQLATLLPNDAVLSLIPPPVMALDSRASVENNPLKITFGVVIHRVNAMTAQQWFTQFAKLCNQRKLHLAGVACKVISHQLIDAGALSLPMHEKPVHKVAIEWLTPTLISTAKKQALGLDQVSPSLSSVVNSVIHRIAMTEPTLAIRLGYEKSSWRQMIQALHNVMCTDDQTYLFNDYYVSSRGQPISETNVNNMQQLAQSVQFKPNLAAYRPLTGRIGKATYIGRIDPIFLHILQWGQWFGAGQGVSQGRGCYRLIF